MIEILNKTDDIELVKQSTFYVRSKELNEDIFISSHLQKAAAKFKELKKKFEKINNDVIKE